MTCRSDYRHNIHTEHIRRRVNGIQHTNNCALLEVLEEHEKECKSQQDQPQFLQLSRYIHRSVAFWSRGASFLAELSTHPQNHSQTPAGHQPASVTISLQFDTKTHTATLTATANLSLTNINVGENIAQIKRERESIATEVTARQISSTNSCLLNNIAPQ